MTLGERIKKARRSLDLTQQKFAEQIGTTQNNIASYEIGRREPSAAAINNICKTFNISEEWLRTGEGGMRLPKPESTIDKLIEEFHLGDAEKQIILEFLQLDDKDRQGVIEYARRLARNRAFQVARDLTLEERADQFAAMAREQFLSEQEPDAEALSAKESDAG